MKKNTLKFLTGALALSLLLTGCGGDKAAETTTTPEETTPEVTADAGEMKLATPGTLTMGTNAAFPPYEYYEGADIVGIDAEIGKAIADKLGLEFTILDMAFDSLPMAVQSGKIDVSLAGMTVNEERKKNVNFTSSYATGVQVIIVPEGSEIAGADDLASLKVGVQQGTTGDTYITDDFGEDVVVRFDKGVDAVLALQTNKVDAVVIDNEPAKSFVAETDGLMILETPYTVEDYAIAVGKDNTALHQAIEKALEELKADGTIDAIIEKYIPSDAADAAA